VLGGRLQELEDVTNQTNRDLRAVHEATEEDHAAAELLERAFASLEHLGSLAETMNRRPGELLKA
jgi:hypothetical protein